MFSLKTGTPVFPSPSVVLCLTAYRAGAKTSLKQLRELTMIDRLQLCTSFLKRFPAPRGPCGTRPGVVHC